jgi:hypothetical protein
VNTSQSPPRNVLSAGLGSLRFHDLALGPLLGFQVRAVSGIIAIASKAYVLIKIVSILKRKNNCHYLHESKGFRFDISGSLSDLQNPFFSESSFVIRADPFIRPCCSRSPAWITLRTCSFSLRDAKSLGRLE